MQDIEPSSVRERPRGLWHSPTHFDLAVTYANFEAALRVDRRAIHHAAIFQTEPRAVPGALNRSAFDLAFCQGCAEVRAGFGKGEYVISRSDQHDRSVVDLCS